MTRTVGSFTYDAATGTLSGPRAYMESDQYRRLMAKVKAGGSAVMDFGLRAGHDPVTTLLVTVQTDYAGWHGSRVFFAAMEAR